MINRKTTISLLLCADIASDHDMVFVCIEFEFTNQQIEIIVPYDLKTGSP